MLLKENLKHLSRIISMALTAILVTITVNAQEADEPQVMVSESGIEYEITGWDTKTIYDPSSYSYRHWETPIYSTVKTREVYPVAVDEFDSPPVFSKSCVESNDPMACTNEKLQQFIASNNFQYPVAAERNDQEGLEYVTFTLNEKGALEGRPSVLRKDNPCKGCSDKAVEIIRQTEGQWQPAVLDGEPVKVILTIPVRFELEDSPFK